MSSKLFNFKLNLSQKLIVMLACFCILMGVSPVIADGWPSNITGTWTVVGNQHVGIGANGLVITQYAGAAGSRSKPIRGRIYGVDAIEGYYNPFSGRIVFMRYIGNTTRPKQFWSGNLSQLRAGERLRIGGNFATFDHNNISGTTGGSLGEYNFYAIK